MPDANDPLVRVGLFWSATYKRSTLEDLAKFARGKASAAFLEGEDAKAIVLRDFAAEIDELTKRPAAEADKLRDEAIALEKELRTHYYQAQGGQT